MTPSKIISDLLSKRPKSTATDALFEIWKSNGLELTPEQKKIIKKSCSPDNISRIFRRIKSKQS